MHIRKLIYLTIKITILNVKYFFQKIGAKYCVYTPGRVASASVYHSINNYRRVIHTHCLGRIFDKNLKHDYMCHFTDEFKLKHRFNYTFLMKLTDLINFHLPFKKKVIILFRDPISRDISGFFKDLDKIIKDDSSFSFQTVDLVNLFFKAIDPEYSLNWFNKEFLQRTKINILNHSFNKEKGYLILKKKRKEYMFIKTEFLSKCEKDLSSFLEIKDFKLQKRNISKNRYGEIYSNFIQTVRFPKAIVNDIYSRPIINHLYTSHEISKFVAKWSEDDNFTQT